MGILFWRRTRVQVVELHGLIAARDGALSLRSVQPALERGFRAARGGTLVLDIDSPGGSPVQSDLIGQAIRRRAERHKVRVVATIGEVGASGGYWLACAADEIVANPMSIVGSIGVVGGGFGFPELLARFGVERRLYTAGENKARLDPFSPERPDDVAFVRKLMEHIHACFKDWVRLRRGERLRGDEGGTFDGSYFLGAHALKIGLVDRLGDLDLVVRELGGEDARMRTWRPRRRRGLLSRLPRLVAREAAGAVAELVHEQPTLASLL